MSFRARLGLFFLLIVVIPIAAIALLVADVTRDSDAGKADARLSTGLQTALGVYEADVEAASGAVTELLADPGVAAALESGESGTITAALAPGARAAGLEQLSIITPDGEEMAVVGGGGETVATARVDTTGRGGELTLAASATGPTEYVEEVTRLTGLEATLLGPDGVLAGPPIEVTDVPAPGESGDVEIGQEELRAAAGELSEAEQTSVALFTKLEAGGFFDSRPRVVAAVAVFIAIAFALIALVFRTLQGQIGSMLDAARRIGSGDFSGKVPVVGRDEMAGLATEFNLMSDRLEAQIDQLRRQRSELDRSTTRLAEAVASGLDQDALLAIVAEAALGGCDAAYAAITLDDGTVIERPQGFKGVARIAARAGQNRAGRDGTQVIARRKTGHALAAPLARDGYVAGTLAVGREDREFDAHEREVFVMLLGRASTSIQNITAHERVSEQAVTDELTGLPNNRAFRETIEREAERAARFGHELSLIILDVDDFKKVNDTHGHLQGDEVLRAIGRILASEPRAIDEPARYGGEEFVVALPETGSGGAVELAERIRARLEGEEIPSLEGGKPLRVTASFGTATLPDAAGDIRELFEAADEALYEAKRQGKNRVVTAPDAVASRQ